MSDAIVPMNDLGIIVPDQKLGESLASSDFLPRIMLMQSGSNAVKEDKIGQGHFSLVVNKESPDDLGKQFDALVFTYRPKAMHLIGAEIVSDIYDVKDPVFLDIKGKAAVKAEGQSFLYGPEFLMYLPNQKKFCTFFFGSKTMHREAPILYGLLGKAVTFSSRLIKTATFSWFGASCKECVTPLANTPTKEECVDVIQQFQSPKAKKKEAAPTAASGGERPR